MGIVVKLLTSAIFATLLYFIIDYMSGRLIDMVSLDGLGDTARYFICRFGILNAINIFVSLYIAGWFTNKMLDYLR
ncbi:MAG: hypothetical protein JXQ66_04780 [Campylobacterales bacterium]|nr:hypothetical protein [Campylobacterales bacterium]